MTSGFNVCLRFLIDLAVSGFCKSSAEYDTGRLLAATARLSLSFQKTSETSHWPFRKPSTEGGFLRPNLGHLRSSKIEVNQNSAAVFLVGQAERKIEANNSLAATCRRRRNCDRTPIVLAEALKHPRTQHVERKVGPVHARRRDDAVLCETAASTSNEVSRDQPSSFDCRTTATGGWSAIQMEPRCSLTFCKAV